MSLGPGQESMGSLTCWSPQEEALCDWRGGLDLYSLKVKAALKFLQPLEVHCPARFKLPLWSSDPFFGFQLFQHHSGLSRSQLQQRMQVTAEDIDRLLQAPPCFQVPALPLELIFCHAWHSLVFRASWLSARGQHRAAEASQTIRESSSFQPQAG